MLSNEQSEVDQTHLEKLRLGIVGCGRVVEQFHLPALMQAHDWQIVAACDSASARRRWIQEKTGGVSTYTSAEELLAAQSLEAVLIATPPVSHAKLAELFLKQGVAVLAEKPGAMDLKEASRVAEVVEATGLPFMVGFNRRFMDPYRSLKSALQSADWAQIVDFEGWLLISPEGWGSTTGFLGDEERGGGVLHDVAAHLIDAVQWLLEDQIETVKCLDNVTGPSAIARLKFIARMKQGLEIRLLAAHEQDYREEWKIGGRDHFLFLYPMGHIVLPARLGGRVQDAAHMRYWLERKLARLGLVDDVMLSAARRQWASFAGLVRGEDVEAPGVDAGQLVSIHRCLEALRRSCASDGSWQSIESIGQADG